MPESFQNGHRQELVVVAPDAPVVGIVLVLVKTLAFVTLAASVFAVAQVVFFWRPTTPPQRHPLSFARRRRLRILNCCCRRCGAVPVVQKFNSLQLPRPRIHSPCLANSPPAVVVLVVLVLVVVVVVVSVAAIARRLLGATDAAA
jgi:hypothetical protein